MASASSGVVTKAGVDESTIRRTVALFEATGCVDKRKYPVERAFTEAVKLYILNLVLEKPGLYLREIKHELQSELGIEGAFLHKTGFT